MLISVKKSFLDYWSLQTTDGLFNQSLALAASAWLPGTAYRKEGIIRDYIYVYYLRDQSEENEQFETYDGADFAIVETNNTVHAL